MRSAFGAWWHGEKTHVLMLLVLAAAKQVGLRCSPGCAAAFASWFQEAAILRRLVQGLPMPSPPSSVCWFNPFFVGVVAMVAVVTSPTTAGLSVVQCSCSCNVISGVV